MTLTEQYMWYYKLCDKNNLTLHECQTKFNHVEKMIFCGSKDEINSLKNVIWRLGFACYSCQDLVFLIVHPDLKILADKLLCITHNIYPDIIVTSTLNDDFDVNIKLDLQQAITGTISGKSICTIWRDKLDTGSNPFELIE